MGVRANSRISRGQTIAYMGRVMRANGNYYMPAMLHFELYSGRNNGQSIKQPSRRPFQRRADLMNPASYLQRWERSTL